MVQLGASRAPGMKGYIQQVVAYASNRFLWNGHQANEG